MKKCMFFLLVCAAVGFAENVNLDNQTSYPSESPKIKMAIQWASSAKEVDEDNKTLMQGIEPSSFQLQAIEKQGALQIVLPEKAQHFRILVWTKEEKTPDFVTNWVDVVSDKTYTVKQEHLVPVVLMYGTGC